MCPRRIATEEAFVIPEVVDGIRELLESGSDDADVNLWRSLLDPDNR